MSIKTADIVKFLKSERGIVAKLSRELGIDQFNLYRWKENNGQPSGDDMIKLYEYLKMEMGEGPDMEKVEVPVKYISLLETQLNTLNRTNEALVKALNVLTNSSSAGVGNHNKTANQNSGSSDTSYKEQALVTEADAKLAAHLDAHIERTNESLKIAKKRGKTG